MHYWNGSSGYGMSMGWGFGLLDLAFHVVVIAAIIYFIIWLLRGCGMGRGHRGHLWHMHSALSILDERFAKGEIDKAEYEERKKALMDSK